MKACNGNVFIERYPEEKELGGIPVSEKACVGNYLGVLRYSENYKYVGMDVHIPHYGVLDVEIGGTEYAVTKFSKLFAIKKSDSYHPINGYVKIRKCVNDHVRDESGEVALYMTENHIEFTNWVEIIEVSDDCKYMREEYVGMFCVSPEDSELLARIGRTKEFCLHESEIKFLTDGE